MVGYQNMRGDVCIWPCILILVSFGRLSVMISLHLRFGFCGWWCSSIEEAC